MFFTDLSAEKLLLGSLFQIYFRMFISSFSSYLLTKGDMFLFFSTQNVDRKHDVVSKMNTNIPKMKDTRLVQAKCVHQSYQESASRSQ
jgi:hypothetical protein